MIQKIILVVLVVFAVGCKTKEKVVNTKLDNKTERAIKGNWVLSTVSFPGSEYIKITSFNVADSKCFEGSLWNFVSNNNKGELVVEHANCSSFNSKITWYVNKDGFMVLKFLTEGVKAKHTNLGYVLRVSNMTETTFQLIDNVNIGGKFVDVVYNFERK